VASIISDFDDNVLKLLHYFVTVRGYNPIILHGAENEIWLENMDSDYKIVRIVSNYIHNDEQMKFDSFRTRQIVKKIKKQTLSFSMNTLSFFVNMGDNVNIDKFNDSKNVVVDLKDISDLSDNKIVIDAFPDIISNNEFKEEGISLFVKLTQDINKKNEIQNNIASDIFKKKVPYVTLGIILINFVVFLLMYLFGKDSHDVQTLVKFGALYKPFVKNGEFFRLITCAFVHIGVVHLLVNSYSLFIIGSQMESFLGKLKYLFVYIISALCGSLMSIVFHETVSAGASGAIFGLLGSMLYFGYNYRVFLGNVLRSQIIPLIILNLVIGFFIPGVDVAAHVGGLLGGIIATQAVGLKHKTSTFEKVNGYIILIIYMLFLGYMIFR